MDKGSKRCSEIKKCRTGRENTNSSDTSWKERNNPPKGHAKNRPFVFCTI